MSYPESVRFLYALGNELKAGAKWGLERMRVLLAELNNPERGLRIVHVAGTNGKGSTCALVAAACRAAGLRIGLYTSPHLVSPTERIQLEGVPVSEQRFAQLFDRVHAAAERLLERGEIDAHPSYFETVTAMAFEAFRGVTDIVVLEVGLGGRLDATNVVQPALTAITPVDYDHEAFLGKTLAAIASEKAGILKPGISLVLATQLPPAEDVIVARAEELRCPVVRADVSRLSNLELSPRASRFEWHGAPYECRLAGAHQAQNALTAICVCEELALDATAIRQGLLTAEWPGRLEYVRTNPDFVLDGAHNPAGARALAEYIGRFCASRPVWLVYGAMRDKAVEEVTSLLFPLAAKLILTAPQFERAVRPEALRDMTGRADAVLTQNIEAAIAQAATAPPEAVVFFTGSLFVVGEARAALMSRT